MRAAASSLRRGGVIAYPTEAVFGLGCDPRRASAVDRLLHLKRRDWRKGLILIAADVDQLKPWLAPLAPEIWQRISAVWPGPVTWVLPARAGTPKRVRGAHNTLAVRVTDHRLTQELCRLAGTAIISTSANRSGLAPARSVFAVRRQFRGSLDAILVGSLGGRSRPSEIRQLSGQVIRSG